MRRITARLAVSCASNSTVMLRFDFPGLTARTLPRVQAGPAEAVRPLVQPSREDEHGGEASIRTAAQIQDRDRRR